MNNTTSRRFPRAVRDPELRPAITGSQRQGGAVIDRRGTRTSPYRRYRSAVQIAERPPYLPCSICFQDMHPVTGTSLSHLPCGHAYCTKCIKTWISAKSSCPTCMGKTLVKDVRPLYL